MTSCAVEGCENPDCPVCSVPRRFPAPAATTLKPASDLKEGAPALNGTKPRPTRDPALIPRRRKPLRP